MSTASDADGRIIHVLIGQIHVVRPPHILFTVLGSCVGIAIVDRASDSAGMAHVLLPDSRGKKDPGMPGKYADRAVDCLVETMLQFGCRADRLIAYLAGGAALCMDGDPHGGIGSANGEVAMAALKRHRITVAETHLGGKCGRKVTLRTAPSEFSVENLRPNDRELLTERARIRSHPESKGFTP